MSDVNYEKLIGDLEGLLSEVSGRCEVLRRKDEAKAAALQDEIFRYVNFEITRLRAEMEYSREPRPQIPPLLPFFPDMHFTEQAVTFEPQQSHELPKTQSNDDENDASPKIVHEQQKPTEPSRGEEQPLSKQPLLPIPLGIASQMLIPIKKEETEVCDDIEMSDANDNDEDFLDLDKKDNEVKKDDEDDEDFLDIDKKDNEVKKDDDDDDDFLDLDKKDNEAKKDDEDDEDFLDIDKKDNDDDDFLDLDKKKDNDDDDFLDLDDDSNSNEDKESDLVDFVADAYNELGIANEEVAVSIEDWKGNYNKLKIRLSDHTEEAVRNFLRKYGPTKQYVGAVRAKLVSNEGPARGITLPFEVNGKTVSLTTSYDRVEGDLKKLFSDNNIPDDIVSTVVELVDTKKGEAQKK